MLSTFVVALMAQATPTLPPENTDKDVVVVGSRESYKLSLQMLRAAQSEFLNRRAQYAPDSRLSFIVSGRGYRSVVGRIKLDFTDGNTRIRVPLSSDGTFDLTALPQGKWWLESNLSRQAVTIEPLVLSPQASRTDYRLGDGRLQCRVLWSMANADASILAAPLVGMFKLTSPCTSRKIGTYVAAPAPIRSATLIEGKRAVPVSVGRNRRSYRLPMDDQTFSNEARIKIATD